MQFKKNRQKRTRFQDLTQQSRDDIDHVADLETSERLSGKGKLSRYRTVITDEADDRQGNDSDRSWWAQINPKSSNFHRHETIRDLVCHFNLGCAAASGPVSCERLY